MATKSKVMKVVAASIVFLFLISGFTALTYGTPNLDHNRSSNFIKTIENSNSMSSFIEKNQSFYNSLVKFSYPLKTNNSKYVGQYNRSVTVMVTFKLNNENSLLSLLKNISSPNNPEFHKYITKQYFENMYSPSSSIYNQSVYYFRGFGVKVQTYSDRISITITGSASSISRIFNVSFGYYKYGQNIFYSINQDPYVPDWMAPFVSQISGLDNFYKPLMNSVPMHININQSMLQHSSNSRLAGYLPPINSSGVQLIYGSDLQVAYDEQTLFNYTYPQNETVATILWSGQYIGPNTTTPYGNLTNGTLLGPFDPSDIYSYYNDTLPSWEPHSKVIAVPLDGAPEPSPLASYDTSGAVGENTLDLEMVGSTAPGATIFNVYGPTSSNTYADQALAFILNPNSSFSELNKVSVISNSWGSPEYNDTAWYQYLQEAQARGITVLASSGDSGDNPKSSEYMQSSNANDLVEFPSSMAYNYFGVTAVGGTTLTLKSSLSIESQVAWYISSSDTYNGGPVGSTGGISEVFPEPIWQSDTIANKVINGQGRGVPDIAAIANNTIIYITVDGTSYYSGQYSSWGTSVASPVEAGIVAEINAVLSRNNQPSLGYLNPLLYELGNDQLKSLANTITTGYEFTGAYNSSLPTLPFYNVHQGRNHVYSATYGYNLVTGWGSIDAYNLTMYILNVNYSDAYGALDGVENILNLTGLNVTSYFSNGTINTVLNASIQQNFFAANSFGAPVYWIQNVIEINGSQETGWFMDYTGWVIHPFYGLYFNSTVFVYKYPAGKLVSLPHTLVMKTWISNETVPMGQIINFQVNSQILRIPVPGASFIIGSYNYSYLWQGKVYTNGPYPSDPKPGGLSPQFGLVGGPSLGIGYFEPPTGGIMAAYLLPMGFKNYVTPITMTFTTSNDQTGEIARNLNWVNQNGAWYLSTLSGNNVQGVISVEPYEHFYNVTFIENGLLPGNSWSVILNGTTESSTTNTITFTEPNGIYSYTLASINGYTISPSSGSILVNGTNVNQSIIFTPVKYSVTFTESGLPSGNWYVNITGQPSSGPISSSTTTYSLSLPNGSYSYTVSTGNKEYRPSYTGSFTVNGAPVSQSIGFSKVTYKVTFTESGLPSGVRWYVNITGLPAMYNPSPEYMDTYIANGTYSFTVSSIDNAYEPSPSSGTFTVSGKNVAIGIDFIPVTYTVTFTESGLPSGATWNVTLNGAKSSSSSSSIMFNESNGTYSYTTGIYGGYSASPYSSTITVSGTYVNVAINFTRITYSVTFTESGLSSGTSWSVILNGLTETSTNGTIIFNEPNGTYSYIISGISGYRSNSYSGTIDVNGNPVSNSVTWTSITYPITISETGIPTGTSWSATLTGTTFKGQSVNVTSSSTTNAITFNEQNGSYSYTIHLPSGYQSNNAKGSVNVSGNSETATFTAQQTMNYLLIGIIAVIVIILVALGVIFLMRSKNKQKVMK